MKRTLIAAAVFVAASGSAFAAQPKAVYLFNATMVGEAVGVEGLVGLYGCVSVSSTAGAVINNTQSVNVQASLIPQAQSYTVGAVTTNYNDLSSSINTSGTANISTYSSNTTKMSGSQSFQAAGGYAYGSQSASVTGGGYEGSQQAAGVVGGFTHTASNSGAHISAGGSIGGGYTTHEARDGSSGSFNAGGGLQAGYRESNYANTSGVAGGFEATEASGQGKVWGYTANEGSGFAAIGEESSGNSTNHTSTKNTFNTQWNVTGSLNTTDDTTTGYVTQYTNTQAPGTLTATTGANAANGVSGNLGINITEGISNAQSNDTSLASVDVGNVFGNAQIFSTQSSAGTATINNFNLNASIGDGSLSGVSGNVGVNVASGIGNVQNNSLAGAVTTVNQANASTTAMVATDDNSQSASMAVAGQFQGTAALGANSLYMASGNIGVNIAGGAGNLQHNGLAIAALNSGK